MASATTATAAAAAASTSSSGLTFKLHPLVIVNISDHYTRVKSQSSFSQSPHAGGGDAASTSPSTPPPPRVFGCVIGIQRGRTVEIFNSFELLYDFSTDSLDRSFLEKKQELYKKVFPNYYILGWYSTGSGAQESDMQIHKALMDINESPVYVLLNPAINHAQKDLPVTIYESALHLQSEREKDVLAQLIDTMVSYSITYKKTKLEFLPNTPRHEAAEASMLAFDPPIDEFINFKGHICGHSGYSLAMKQILVHEVEKQKFLRESISRSMHSNIGRDMGTQVFPREGSGGELSTDMKLAKDKSDPKAWKTNTTKRLSTFGTSGSVRESVKVNNGVAKWPSGGSSNFFDRFRKSNKGSQNPDHYLQKQATMERDSRPLLFKFNEGFTNAVKRPVRIRDLLL